MESPGLSSVHHRSGRKLPEPGWESVGTNHKEKGLQHVFKELVKTLTSLDFDLLLLR
jgi:hypothetical protein